MVKSIQITVPLSFYVPNTFTPNGDGVNDEFTAKADGILKFEMMIFDRWGNLVFTSNNINKGWDGKYKGSEAVMDAYVYSITVQDLKKHDKTYRGVINLIK